MAKYLVICVGLVFMAFLSGCDEINQLIEGDTEKPTDGIIEGSVELEDAEEHSGVKISLKGTAFATTSQSDGTFRFSVVPKGNYSISFVIDGFVTLDEEAEVIAGETTRIEAFLEREIPLPPALPNP